MLPWEPTIPTLESAQAFAYTTEFGPDDVLMGRGTPAVKHPGNKLYRSLIDAKKVGDR